MQRPCSGIRCPMNASTCKCTGFEGCEYYLPSFTREEMSNTLRFLADMIDSDSVKEHLQYLYDIINEQTSELKE